MKNTLRALPVLLCLGLALSPSASGDEKGKGPRALLVGVTQYPNLSERFQLTGGANDVLLMEGLLREQFGFPAENITILSEERGKKDPRGLPTRANIERECKRLAAEVRPGEQVLVALSGHGSLQPEKEAARFPQPDGRARIFLPRDVGKWDGSLEAVPNAIPGEELGDWLRPIAARKAFLTIIVDACHSGEALRGAAEVSRQLPPEAGLGIPQAALDRAEKRARERAPKGEKSRGRAHPGSALSLSQEEGVALLYACQSTEETVERLYPSHRPGESEKRYYGLLTHTLNEVVRSLATNLTTAKAAPRSLNYRELAALIQRKYTAMERAFPTLVFEGDGSRAFLGRTAIKRSNVAVSEKDDKLVINAGQLHGMTAGSILAVFPAPGQPNESKALGHVRITAELKPAEAVVEPCAHAGLAASPKAGLIGGRCEMAQFDFGDLKLTVALDSAGSKEGPRLREELDKLAKGPGAPIKVAAELAAADWLVRLDRKKVSLLPAAEWARAWGGKKPSALGPVDLDDKVGAWLKTSLARVARAQQLLRLAATDEPEGLGDFRPRARLELRLLKNKSDKKGREVPGPVPTFHVHDLIKYEISNPGDVAVDVTVLYLDSAFGISAIFPAAGRDENNRLRPGARKVIDIIPVDEETTGREHVVLIAVKADEGLPVRFDSLAQPTVAKARKLESKRGGERGRGLGSPLGLLLEKALYQEGSARGMRRQDRANFVLDVVPVQIESGRRPE